MEAVVRCSTELSRPILLFAIVLFLVDRRLRALHLPVIRLPNLNPRERVNADCAIRGIVCGASHHAHPLAPKCFPDLRPVGIERVAAAKLAPAHPANAHIHTHPVARLGRPPLEKRHLARLGVHDGANAPGAHHVLKPLLVAPRFAKLVLSTAGIVVDGHAIVADLHIFCLVVRCAGKLNQPR